MNFQIKPYIYKYILLYHNIDNSNHIKSTISEIMINNKFKL